MRFEVLIFLQMQNNVPLMNSNIFPYATTVSTCWYLFIPSTFFNSIHARTFDFFQVLTKTGAVLGLHGSTARTAPLATRGGKNPLPNVPGNAERASQHVQVYIGPKRFNLCARVRVRASAQRTTRL